MSIDHTSVVAVDVKANSELFCMLATLVCMYLLGCKQSSILLTYKSHHGLLHYTLRTTLRKCFQSDSDWAKHRSSRKSVSSGFIFLFGNLLYRSFTFTESHCTFISRSWDLRSNQCVLWWSSLGILPDICCGINREGGHNHQCGQLWQAGPFSAGVGCIRHISVCVLLMQPRVKEKGLIPSRVPNCENRGSLGTKRLHLICLCKVYNMDTSEFVGINAYYKIQELNNVKTSIRLLQKSLWVLQRWV